MALTAGTRIGPYAITAQLGVGGMGEVYRATDTKLKRDVAVKVLPESLAGDADRLARFQREAEVLASLNHPNIAAIYGLEDSGDTKALAMELVEGPTLADRIAQGAIPVDEALPLARQIAEALEAAHEQGIIHRDLKPSNVKVRPDGTVKVLDFGLAKALEPVGAAALASASMSPTITTPAMTQAGMILGTAAYMSPEQAKGRAVDARADIWAFGAVLYEMLSGRRAFDGEDTTDVLGAVVRLDPDWEALPAGVSPRIRQVIRACLQKSVKQRIAHIQDVRLALEGVFETPAPQIAEVTAPAQPTWQHAMPFAASAGAAAFLVAGLVAWALWPAPEPGVVSRFDYDLPDGQAFRFTGRPFVALSPDARAFVYNTAGGLYLRSAGELEAQLMPGTEPGLTSPVFSPDGSQIAYWDIEGQLKRIGTTGGAPVVVADGLENPFGLSWGSDGTILIGQAEGIYRVPATGGSPELVIPAMEGERLYGAQLLPDGVSVLFSATTGDWDDAQIVVQSLARDDRTVLIEGGNEARYVPTGHLIYALGDGLFGMAFDPASRAVSGGAVPLVQGVRRANATGVAQYSVSADGTLIYVSGGVAAAADRTLLWVDRNGREEPIAIEPSTYIYPRLSPDGARVALDDRNEANDIWIWDFALGTRTRLTIGGTGGQYPLWTADGTRIAFDPGTGDIDWKAASNVGRTERIAAGVGGPGEDRSPSPYFFSPAGTELIFRDQANPDTNDDIVMIALEDGAEAIPLLNGSYRERNAELSPNGRWMAYDSNESGEFEIYVRPFPNVDDDRVQVSNAGGVQPLWSRDGRELFYLEPGPPVRLMSVSVDATDASISVRGRAPLIDFPYPSNGEGRGYDVSPDGQRFLTIRAGTDDAGVPDQIIVVQNFFEELRRLVPTGD